MVLDIFDYIADGIKTLNPWIVNLTANCIRMKDGRVVNLLGYEKTDYGFNDNKGISGYIRLEPTISYTDVQKRNSCETEVQGTIKGKLVIYAIDNDKPLDPYKVENKITNDLNRLGFGLYTGPEKKIKVIVNSTSMNFEENFINETTKNYESGANIQIIIFNFTLTWIAVKDDCLDNCNVFEDIKCNG